MALRQLKQKTKKKLIYKNKACQKSHFTIDFNLQMRKEINKKLFYISDLPELFPKPLYTEQRKHGKGKHTYLASLFVYGVMFSPLKSVLIIALPMPSANGNMWPAPASS